MNEHTLETGEFHQVFTNIINKFDDNTFVIELLSIFVIDGPVAADRLVAAIMLSDAVAIRNSLHSLKNILGTLQSEALFLLAERASEAFRNDNQVQMQADAAELISGTRRLVLAADIVLGNLKKAVTQ